MRYEHFLLDKGGLKHLLKKIKDKFATNKALDDEVSRATGVEESLQESIDQERLRAEGSESSLKDYTDSEVSKVDAKISTETLTARANEDEIKSKLSLEISRATGVEDRLQGDLNSLYGVVVTEIDERKTADSMADSRLSSLETALPEAGKVNQVYLDDVALLDGKEVHIYSKDIKVLTLLEDVSKKGEIDKLYRTPEGKLYFWDGSSYKELGQGAGGGSTEPGKAYIIVADTLPVIGEPDVLVIKSDDHTIYQWVGTDSSEDGWQKIGGSDDQLRADFEAHTVDENAHHELFSLKADVSSLEAHESNLNNPHAVTKEQIGLDKVDNTSDLEKPISNAVQEALDKKLATEDLESNLTTVVKYADVKDDLNTMSGDMPLSANQGVVLDSKITGLETKLSSLGSALMFKGVVASIEALNTISSKSVGDCWQIYSKLDPELEDDSHDGEMYAWTGSSWQMIVASATDMSSMMATTAEINKIISDYS